MSAQSFENQFNALGGKYHLIAIDLPGLGNSSAAERPDEVYSLPGYAKIVKEVIAELKLREFVLVGHSLGGHIALEAVPLLTGLKGLLIFGTPPLGVPPDFEKAFLPNPNIALAFKAELTEEEVDLLASAILLPQSPFYEILKNDIRRADGNIRTGLGASVFQAHLLRDELQVVKDLSVPIAVLHGENELLVNEDYVRRTHFPTLWKGMVHLIPDGAHCPHIQNPPEFNRIFDLFIKDIETGA